MITNNFFIVAAIVIYLLVMLAIGFVFSKNNSNTEDFYLGGRKLGPFVTAMSAEASDMSSWLLMGLPGVATNDVFRVSSGNDGLDISQ